MNTKSCRPLPKDRAEPSAPKFGTRTRLPQDLIDKAVNRLGMLGLLSAVAHPLFHYGTHAVLPDDILQATHMPPSYFVGIWAAIICGLAIFVLTRSRKLNADFMLDVGLIFEVVGAFCIGLIEASTLSIGTHVDAGPKGIALWITLFVLVVPNTLAKTALAALASASMAPIALVVAAYANNQPAPAPFLFLLISIPNLLIAAIAIILSRFVYTLGTDVSRAREMGSYKLIELLGRGGMGEVWRAEHRLLARPAAIKLIQPEMLGGSDSKATTIVKRRFEREAQATAMLSSPHTIDLYDFGVAEDGAFYYVMELLQGVDLQTLIEKYGPVPSDRAGYIIRQVCSSLEEAHHGGLVHRDIKPANIYTCRYGLEYDFVKVLDFGIVKSAEDLTGLTKLTNTNAATGTPGFMAPEMALGNEVDGRADIYALGCVAYWLLTGKLVFEEETFVATLLAHATKPPIPPSKRTEIEIPPQLEKLVMWCLEKEPQHRPSSAGELRRAISQFALADSWTPEQAEKWWKLHMPEKTVAGVEIDLKERGLQANVQQI